MFFLFDVFSTLRLHFGTEKSSEEDYDSYSAIDDGNILYHIYLKTMHIWILQI
jgi:hypothetical protein